MNSPAPGATESRPGFGPPRLQLSHLVDAPVMDGDGRPVGRLEDLVVDLDRPGGTFPVTSAVVAGRGGELVGLSVGAVAAWSPDEVRLIGDLTEVAGDPGPTELLLRRDVLDAPVVMADPPRRTRVSDVVLSIEATGPVVSGLDVSARSAWRRLLRLRPEASAERAAVPLSHVHLTSRHGHAAQMAAPGSLVFRLGPDDMAEVLTRLSVARAREVVEAADEEVTARALELLHPHVRNRVAGITKPRRRMLRLHGWRLHRPLSSQHGSADTHRD